LSDISKDNIINGLFIFYNHSIAAHAAEIPGVEQTIAGFTVIELQSQIHPRFSTWLYQQKLPFSPDADIGIFGNNLDIVTQFPDL
jgi:hypothetical protein